jgi:hypothetical protein
MPGAYGTWHGYLPAWGRNKTLQYVFASGTHLSFDLKSQEGN